MTVFGNNIFTYIVVTFNGIDKISYYEVDFQGTHYSRAELNPESGSITFFDKSYNKVVRILVN
jgi:hypothetical protein